jgi:hypothetical protein
MKFTIKQKSEIRRLLEISDRETRWIAVREYCQGLARPLSENGHDWSHVASEICKQHEIERRHSRRT